VLIAFEVSDVLIFQNLLAGFHHSTPNYQCLFEKIPDVSKSVSQYQTHIGLAAVVVG
jgi:hypothetical protein